jgi:RNA polymerase sigma-70 factor (ECF subfamily)
MFSSAYDEKDLLRQVAEGSEAAFRELFYRYADRLGNYVLRLTQSKMHAEEIVQDVFLKIWTNREALSDVDNFNVYLFVVSRNQTLNAMRKVIRLKGYQKEWERNQAAAVVENSQKPVEEEGLYAEGLINSAVDQLPSQQRKVWLLSRKDGLTHPQIATAMGISRETVKKYIMHANQSITRFIRSRLSTQN